MFLLILSQQAMASDGDRAYALGIPGTTECRGGAKRMFYPEHDEEDCSKVLKWLQAQQWEEELSIDPRVFHESSPGYPSGCYIFGPAGLSGNVFYLYLNKVTVDSEGSKSEKTIPICVEDE